MTEGGITSLKTSFSLTKAGSVGTPMAAVYGFTITYFHGVLSNPDPPYQTNTTRRR